MNALFPDVYVGFFFIASTFAFTLRAGVQLLTLYSLFFNEKIFMGKGNVDPI